MPVVRDSARVVAPGRRELGSEADSPASRSTLRIRIETYAPFDSAGWPRGRGAAAQEPDKCSLGARIGFNVDCYCAAVLRIEKACPDKPQINRAMGTVKFGSHRGVDSDVVSVVDSLKPDAISAQLGGVFGQSADDNLSFPPRCECKRKLARCVDDRNLLERVRRRFRIELYLTRQKGRVRLTDEYVRCHAGRRRHGKHDQSATTHPVHCGTLPRTLTPK